jgi:hypothetical protein
MNSNRFYKCTLLNFIFIFLLLFDCFYTNVFNAFLYWLTLKSINDILRILQLIKLIKNKSMWYSCLFNKGLAQCIWEVKLVGIVLGKKGKRELFFHRIFNTRYDGPCQHILVLSGSNFYEGHLSYF